MIAYIDTSALLRLILRERGALDELAAVERLVASEILDLEACRTLDRLRLQGALTAEEASARRAVLGEWLEAIDLVLLRRPILQRAAEPLPVSLGTLDAIHLSTALVWRDRSEEDLVVATHDQQLAAAARTYGFAVLGA